MADQRVTLPSKEADYDKWMRQHPRGYVINAPKTPSPAALMVWHRAHCHHIRPDGTTRFVEGPFMKACAMDPGELAKWAKSRTDALNRCPDCPE
jgi:hypothetical protein